MVDLHKSFHVSTTEVARRHYAYAMDICLWLATGHIIFGYNGLIDYVRYHVIPGRYWVAAGIVLLGYRLLFLCKDGLSGYSPGKWVCDLRVVETSTGEPIGPLRSMMRNAILIVPIIGEIIIWAQLHFGNRSFDKWAKCRVVDVADDLCA